MEVNSGEEGANQGRGELNPLSEADLRGLSDEQRQKLVSFTATAVQYKGMLPPPQMLKQYDEVVPGMAERILVMTEKRAAHRERMDVRNIGLFERGQWFAFAAIIVVLGATFAFFYFGFPLGGSAVLACGVFGVIQLYLKKDKE